MRVHVHGVGSPGDAYAPPGELKNQTAGPSMALIG